MPPKKALTDKPKSAAKSASKPKSAAKSASKPKGEAKSAPKKFASLNEKSEVTNVYLILLCGSPLKIALKRVGQFLNIPGGYKREDKTDLDAMKRIFKEETGEDLPPVKTTIHFRSTMLFIAHAPSCPKRLELVPWEDVKKQVSKPSASGPKLREILVSNLAYNMVELEKLLKK